MVMGENGSLQNLLLIVAVTAAAFFGLTTAYLLFKGWFAHLRSIRVRKKRSARAIQGEEDARHLLEEEGYEIVSSQETLAWQFYCDEEEIEVDLRVDYLVEREGLRYVAEVKTGELAPSLRNAATRRQLLEYRVAYQVDGALLVAVEDASVQVVRFY